MKQAHTKKPGHCPGLNAQASDSTVHVKNKTSARSRQATKAHRGGDRSKGSVVGDLSIQNHSGSTQSVPVLQGERLLTADELATRIGYSVRRVRKFASVGKLPAVRLNKRDFRFHWPTVIAKLTNAPLE
jgi:hypothetical protein